MKKKSVAVDCPATGTPQIVDVSPEGEVTWCTRTLKKPNCDGACLTEPQQPTPQSEEN